MDANKWTLNLAPTSSVTAASGLTLGGKQVVANLDGDVEGIAYGIYSGAYTAHFNIGVGAHITGWNYYGIYHLTVIEANFQIDGSVMGGPVGMYLGGFGENTIDTGTTGLISGQTALLIEATNAQAKYAIHNDGEITGTDAISATSWAGLEIVNGKDGEIVGSSSAISGTSGYLTIFNHGTIATSKGGIAIEGGLITSIVNDGRIVGTVHLGDGVATFDSRGGIVKGTIEGNGGNDTLIVDNAKVTMVEKAGEGIDTVRSSVSYTLGDNLEQLTLFATAAINGTGNALNNKLRGNIANNSLYGLDGDDQLYGGKGNDRLFGGEGNDTFYFATGNGKDKVMDYVDGTDTIDLKGWPVFTNFKDLMKHHAADSGYDLLIAFGSDSLLILGVHKADLTSSDILV
jgi:Ca2+-binding RTX toxin-like protein